MTKPIAVIILNWNGDSLLKRYLPSVIDNTPTDIADVIVADNGSTDGSLETLRNLFPQAIVWAFDTNHGFAAGYNRCVKKAADYEYVVMLNSDVRTPKGWLQPLYEYMNVHPDVAAAQPKILHDGEESDIFEYAGAAGGYLDKHGYPYCRGRLFSTIEPDNGQYDDCGETDIFWASGACFMVRTALYNQTGGLDTHFFAHMEEIDLCWRLQLAGHHVRMVPTSKVYHLGGGSLPQGNPHKTYLNFRNNLLLLHKNMPQKRGKKLLFIRRIYDTMAIIQSFVTLHLADSKAIIKAHRDYKKMRRNYNSYPSHDLLKEMPECKHNIIIDYYLKRKRHFFSVNKSKNY